jgi:hypothetical protein
MPIDTHVRVAAWLHIALGILWVGVGAIVGLLFGAFGAFMGAAANGSATGILALIAGFGFVVFLIIMAFPVLEIIGGVLLLRGSPAGRAITIVFSVLELINIPFGTAIGIYSLWALLRAVPQPALAPVGDVVPQGGVQSY